MKKLKIMIEVNIEMEDDEDWEEKYSNLLSELDDCGYNSGFSFKVVGKEVKELKD